jgi:hypothetical protein
LALFENKKRHRNAALWFYKLLHSDETAETFKTKLQEDPFGILKVLKENDWFNSLQFD